MATLASFLSFSRLPRGAPSSSSASSSSLNSVSPSPFSLSFLRQTKPIYSQSPSSRTMILCCSAPLGDYASNNHNSGSKKSVLANLIQEIEPLDVSLIQKDVAANTVDAMKRTISGMLGLLPSDQFQVYIEALWEPLSKLLISSMMTGYTLRNAEYRLCLEKNLEIYDRNFDRENSQDSKIESGDSLVSDNKTINFGPDRLNALETMTESVPELPDFGEMTPETQQYIINLQSRLSSVKRELREVKRKTGALQMQQFVGEEKNDLLDYLRSLQPEKLAELSEPTCPEVKETIYSVVYGLLATLSPKMHSRAPDPTDSTPTGAADNLDGEDFVDVVENTSLQFQPQISLTRDYLARLLFWCMLLGHYIRGLEYRLELMELLSLPCLGNSVSSNGEQAL